MTVVLRGPFLHAVERETIFREMVNDIIDTVTTWAEVRLQYYGTQFFKNPTGNWSDNVVVDRSATDRTIRDDVVYNSWLEGVGSRNAASRFKGYRLWRLTAQDTNAKRYEIAQLAMERGRYVERLNGV